MTKAQKIQYSEHEAANLLGVSIDQFRSLVRDHIVKDATAPSTRPSRRTTHQIWLYSASSRGCRAALKLFGCSSLPS